MILRGEDERCVSLAARLIGDDELVAFPTETVYGLGGSALSDLAAERIFALKGRPHSDPLIAHVSSLAMAEDLIHPSCGLSRVLQVLGKAFWPGPLTLVCPASPRVSLVVRAQGATVGLRMPAHPVALSLIERAGVALAAPSANRFGHASPTCAQHVLDDFGDGCPLVLDGGNCSVGIESTVARIESESEIVILRRGVIGADALESVLTQAGLSVRVRVQDRWLDTGAVQDSPGQLITHYAPLIPAFILGGVVDEHRGEPFGILTMFAIVDFSKRFASWKPFANKYIDLSEEGNAEEACSRFFRVVRELEPQDGLKGILLPDLSRSSDEISRALADRICRAASGRKAFLFKGSSAQVFV